MVIVAPFDQANSKATSPSRARSLVKASSFSFWFICSSDEELWQPVEGYEADLIFGGHHHRPLDVHVKGKHVVNVGSVSNPVPPDLRASYVILPADKSGYQVEHYQVDYDREEVIKQMEALRHPGANYVIAHMRGRKR